MQESLSSHDRDIREPLFDYLESVYGRVRILEEKRTGRARADVVMVTEQALIGIEIKSDRDTYTRLAGQVKNYDLYYDYNIVVAGSSHGLHIGEHVPQWWGIITVEETEGELDFYCLREPQLNPNVKPERKISILWRPELARIQERNGLPAYSRKSKKYVQTVVLDRVPEELLWPQVCEELFERDYTTIEQELASYRKAVRKPVRRGRKRTARPGR